MVHLVAGLALGLAMALPGGFDPGAWRISYVHLLVLGWASQMIFGVAYWMFPRRAPADAHQVPWAGWVCFIALNAGAVVRTVAEPALAAGPSPAASACAVTAAALQLLSVVSFVWLAWPRVTAR